MLPMAPAVIRVRPHKHACGSVLLFVEGTDPADQSHAEHDSEQRQAELAHFAAESHTERHSLVLDETQAAPLSDERNLLAQGHVRLDQDFDDLVYDNERKPKQEKPVPS